MGLMDDVKSKKKQKEAENWFNMGIKSQDPEKKLDYFTRSLELEPNNVSGWVKKGKILESMGKFDEAKKCYDKATFLNPSLDIPLKKMSSPEEENRVFAPDTVQEETEYIQENIQYTEDETEHSPATSAEETESKTFEEAEEVVSFTPPLGEESLFSNMRTNEATVPEEENEIIEVNPEPVRSSEVIGSEDLAVEVVPGKGDEVEENTPERVQDNAVPAQFTEPESDRTIGQQDVDPAFDKDQAESQISADSNEKIMKRTDKAGISSYIEMEGKNANLRIPMSETIKFWLVGALVLFVLYMIIRLIGS